MEMPKFDPNAILKAQFATIKPVDEVEPIKVPEFKEPIHVKKAETEKHKILREHKFIESNIPVNSPYWQMKD